MRARARFVVAAAFVVAGCGGEEEAVVLCVDRAAETDHFTQIQLTLTFAAGQDGPVCQPAQVFIGGDALPYCIEARPGPQFDQLVVLDALGMADTFPGAHRQVMVPFQAGKRVEDDVLLSGDCGDCGSDDLECADPDGDGANECVGVPWPGVLLGEGVEISSTQCDPEHPR